MTQLDNKLIPKPALDYPFERSWAPEAGKPFEVSDGVFWLRMPIPISLDHINLWLLKDEDGWVIVDSGVDHESCKAVWDQVFKEFFTEEQVNRIIITHFHMDHIGLASWLALRCNCPVQMTHGEFEHYHEIVTRDDDKNSKTVKAYFHSLGFDAATRDAIVDFFRNDNKPAQARVQPAQVDYLKEGQVLTIGDKHWEVITGNGHSPEHACLFNRTDDVLISGDQSLPRISSNVSVFPGSNVIDPLGDWISSCEKLRDIIPQTTLVLPAHQEPFKRNPDRMQHMIDEHYQQLAELKLYLVNRVTAIDARRHLFNRKLDQVQKVLATGETMAHLRYLTQRGEVTEQVDEDGVAWFQVIGPELATAS